ncbi:MAG: tRNA preQ1(34) S-adenosylmethionine ribosyltransferase-isomerase QueA [Ardenticatenaceae bacterium]|nr:tRNA preQ1(34) S-adenosylmethionine ribosyltransferase-isomerase QueA [Anaerolineales bacterium]MCB8920406.1 tRNA preQ1(34) S-adenosylmethionine ribosyltransferase-isomerase QueA [Ardenticatenaceae bacterium]MCB8989361.1 tRNA preQ1(34) S-adenosylmethionine ribosyltransferase-isomerase QueA [Ardenticatenaceae bacterium]MCB9004516.1 tRNA preQ1(34) S-adenosylmethionine ribosyltransferase-isomerase QueA [Ardenticatenaceae bacterium]
MKTADFNYTLPQELIAQRPLANRDDSRLLVLHKGDGRLEHRHFTDIVDYLNPGDILVVNDTRVIPARLYGRKPSGGKAEILLLEQLDDTRWKALVGGKKLDEGAAILLDEGEGLQGTVTAVLDGPQREITFNQALNGYLEEHGHTPLPPYIHETLDDPERYQTIYSRYSGSAAAPTAGLHFTPDLLFALRDKGVLLEMVTLHVGLDTFKPVDAENVSDHLIHSEWATISPDAAKRINEAKLAGGRLIAVGTTAVRTLETGSLRSAGIVGSLQDISLRDARGETSGFCPWKPVSAFESPTDLFLYPGYKFRAVDAMITNFHLPQSSLLMLVSAFAGRETVMAAYETAVHEQYRFYSFGDAMLIL